MPKMNESNPSEKTDAPVSQLPRPKFDDNEVNFLVGVMSGWRPEPHSILDAWEELERRKDEQAEIDEKVVTFPGPNRKSTDEGQDAGSTPAGSTK
jgi:hypothetical protein